MVDADSIVESLNLDSVLSGDVVGWEENRGLGGGRRGDTGEGGRVGRVDGAETLWEYIELAGLLASVA